MGPRLCRRGNTLTELGIAIAYIASMGPRLCRRGNFKSASKAKKRAKLQWGHVFVDVEIIAAIIE